jgi:type II secretory pathway pseudopilin PulG
MNRYKGEWIASTFELLVAVLLAALVAAVMLSVYRAGLQTADEGILRAQLRALRMQGKLFRAVHGHAPQDLRELITDSYSQFPMGAAAKNEQPGTILLKPEVVQSVAMDEVGYPVDPWGKRFEMEPGTGRIHSVTKHYEDW